MAVLSTRGFDNAIRVEGLAELRGALAGFNAEVAKILTTDLKVAAEPVRQRAEQLMATEISHMKEGSPWIRARTGTTKRGVYVAPVERGVRRAGARSRGGVRPKFADLAMSKAYEPAQRAMQGEVLGVVEAAVGRAAARLR